MKRNSRPWRVRNLLWVGLLFAVSCSGKSGPGLPRQDAEDWLRSVRDARANVRTLRAEARVEMRRKERRYRFDTSILAAFPARLYAEVNGIGLVGAVVSADEESVLAFLPSKNRAYRGNGTEILGRLLGIEQPTRDWVALLLGTPPQATDRAISFADIGGESVMKLGDKVPRVTLVFDRRTSWLRSYEESLPVPRTITYGKPMETPAGPFPSEIRIRTKTASVEFRFSKVTVNMGIPDELFRIPLPANVVPEPLEGGEILRKEE